MGVDPNITSKFDSLINDLTAVLHTTGLLQDNYQRAPDWVQLSRIRTEGLNLIGRVNGRDGDHYKAAAATDPHGTSSAVALLGVLQAAKNDYEQGFLFDLRALLIAEVLGDFMDQADALLNAGYHIPAASLLGAVLEDALRKLSDKHGIAYPANTKLDSLNAGLAKAGVYNTLVQKRITALGDIRNNADHGHFTEFKAEDVEDMLKWVRRFMADYLG